MTKTFELCLKKIKLLVLYMYHEISHFPRNPPPALLMFYTSPLFTFLYVQF